MITQVTKVLTFMKRHRTITPREALMDLGIYRLSDCIFKLRNEGWSILTETKTHPDTKAKYASYRLVGA